MPHIAFILDRSGSMESVKNATISSFNEFVHSQTNACADARFTLVLFDDQYEVPFDSIPITEVSDLHAGNFVPRGSTALLDAIGRTIDELGAKLAALPEDARPRKVMVAILTDGQENASTHYTWRDISRMIRHQSTKYNWEFFFLGAGQDAIATAANMNIRASHASSFVADSAGILSSHRALSRKFSAGLKASAPNQKLTEEESRDLHAPLSQIAEEERRKDEDSRGAR